MRFVCLALVVVLPACSRPVDESLRFHLERPSHVYLDLTQSPSAERRELLRGETLAAGAHRAELREGRFFLDGKMREEVPAGRWQWRARAHEAFKPVLRGWIGQPGAMPWDPQKSWAAADGEPSAVAADSESVYLGSSAGQGSGVLVALDSAGNVRWNHQRDGLGVHAIGCDGGVLYVLADRKAAAGGGLIYKLDSKTGHPLPWAGRAESDLPIASLWPPDAVTRPATADALTAGNGRLYLSFTQPGFMAVLDAGDGHYVTTLSGPGPAQMATSMTPTRSAEGVEQIVDFGVVVLARSALSYFLMPHDPPWVAANTTHWLARDEQITAFTMRADTMKSGDIQLYVALGAPHSQVQMRVGADPSGFVLSAGTPGGRSAPLGVWQPEALRDVRSLAVDASGQLWAAEGDAWPRRFSRWTTTGNQGKLVREFFPPPGPNGRGAVLFPGDPAVVIAAGCEWHLEGGPGEAREARCVGIITDEGMTQASFMTVEQRLLLVVENASGLVFYERRAPGEWALLSRLSNSPDRGLTYWADSDGDEEPQPAETLHLTAEALSKNLPNHVRPDGTLITRDGAGYRWLGWTTSGAPTFEWEHPVLPAPAADADALLAAVLPPDSRASLRRTPDGRAYFLAREGALCVKELEGAQSLRELGQGWWESGKD